MAGRFSETWTPRLATMGRRLHCFEGCSIGEGSMAAQEWEQTANFLKTPQQRHEPKANVECSAQERDFPGPASIKRLIHSHLPEMSCKWIKTVDSAVTTAWGVRWNEMQIARDVF